MTFNTLIAAVQKQPEIAKSIVGEYNGIWWLNIRLDPDDKNKYALALHVGTKHLESFAREITINGEKIKVVVESGFKVRPLKGE